MTRAALLDVLRGVEPVRRPVWLMRQAGRYLPEYRALREKAGSFLNLCYNPKLACEVTLQPLRRFDFDAAILFSDILVVPHAMGLALDFKEGEGPKLETVDSLKSVEALSDGLGSEAFDRVFDTVGLVAGELDGAVALIGFCGGPWTVASYMIMGGSSDRKRAVAVAVENPPWFQLLMQRLVDVSVAYLLGQIRRGAKVVQIFDSWAGDIPLEARQRVVLGPIALMVAGVRAVFKDFPVIVFARGVGAGHAEVAEVTGANCIGVEQGLKLGDVLRSLPATVSVQGNLAPDTLLGPESPMAEQVVQILRDVPKRRHIFNLGHGIVPQVDPDRVSGLLEIIRGYDRGQV